MSVYVEHRLRPFSAIDVPSLIPTAVSVLTTNAFSPIDSAYHYMEVLTLKQ